MARCPFLAQIHIAKKDLGLDDDTYRAALQEVTGKSSCSTMSQLERKAVVEHFKQKGWKPTATLKRKRSKKGAQKDWRAPRIRYIKAMWHQLGEADVLRNASDDGLESFCKKFMQGEKLEWASSPELNRIIEALKSWITREGV